MLDEKGPELIKQNTKEMVRKILHLLLHLDLPSPYVPIHWHFRSIHLAFPFKQSLSDLQLAGSAEAKLNMRINIELLGYWT